MIPHNFQEAFTQVKKLVETFQKDEAHYLSPKYQEAEVRMHFLDKFFVALGWDVLHQTQQNPYEREVRIEKSVIVAGRGKRADYAFYLLPNFAQSKFMVEAKKPSLQLDNNQDYFQAIRYGWNSNNPVAVLTDFEQFRVLDSRYKPSIETALSRSLKKFHYLDYADEAKFSEIYWLFSREAVAQGSIEKYVAGLPKLRGAKQAKLFATQIIQPVDESFLNELDDYREQLARAFKNKNADLSGEDLTEITQKTLDRLVFIRFLEDKLVEADEVIDNLGNKSGDAWRDFVNEAKRLDKIYNGIIFKPHSILDSESFSPDLKAFEQIRDDLSHKNSPYDFNTIPIHILGSIYERFLGKEITVTDKRAKVEEKPEVRKAGGVYYTPEYIVKYIVENTIGKLIAGKKPEEIAKLKFADIACGSGSFLLGAFDYLIKFHTDFYNANKTRKADAIKQNIARETIDGTLQLTVQFKREILLNNIFGVDVDAQAVEVAQLSLYLKLLEEETTSTKQQYLTGFREQLLPSLDKNIICGNSLIDFDIMSGMLFDSKDFRKLNPMNFQSSFPEVFRNGGFDAIIGNPPYGADLNEIVKDYLGKKYIYQSYQLDSYLLFLEKSISELIKQNGFWGMIIPNPWLTNVKQDKIRKFVIENTILSEIIHFKFPVFPKVTVDTEIVILKNSKENESDTKVIIAQTQEYFEQKDENLIKLLHSQKDWKKEAGKTINIFLNDKEKQLLAKLGQKSISLEFLFDLNVGIKPYQVGKGKPPQTKETVKTRPFDSKIKESEFHKQYLRGSDINRYIVAPIEIRFIKYGEWLAEPRPAANFEVEKKIFVRQTGDSLIACLDNQKLLCLNNMHVLTPKKVDLQIEFYLGLVNSSLMNWFHHSNNPEVGEALAEVKRTHVAQLPICQIDFTNPTEKEMHDKIVNLVEQMIEAKKNLAAARLDNERQLLERYCKSLDSQIDCIVYRLYDLDKDEIALVGKG
jgi:adenine-specific DNA-methyltransferase